MSDLRAIRLYLGLILLVLLAWVFGIIGAIGIALGLAALAGITFWAGGHWLLNGSLFLGRLVVCAIAFGVLMWIETPIVLVLIITAVTWWVGAPLAHDPGHTRKLFRP
jgi:hypothetical protein